MMLCFCGALSRASEHSVSTTRSMEIDDYCFGNSRAYYRIERIECDATYLLGTGLYSSDVLAETQLYLLHGHGITLHGAGVVLGFQELMFVYRIIFVCDCLSRTF